MAAEIGAAVIGAGFGAQVHLPGLQHLDGVRVVGIAGASRGRADAAATAAGIEAYDDYRRLIDRADVQLVTISAPAPLHHELTLAALERGKHVICEKPFASSLDQAEDMLRRAQAAGVVHAIDFEFRFIGLRQQMKALLDAGYVGEPRLFGAVSLGGVRLPSQEVRPWSVTREGMGGPLGAVAVHLMDAACWLLGDVASVSARLDTYYPERKVTGGQVVPATCEDNALIVLRFRRAAVAMVEASFVMAQPVQRLELHGDRGSLIAPDAATLMGGREGAPLEPVAIEDRFKPAGGWTPQGPPLLAPFAELAGRVVARIRGEQAGDFPTFDDGVRSQRVMDAVYRSADSGRTVELE